MLHAMPSPIRRSGSAEWLILDLLLEQTMRSWGAGELVDEIGTPVFDFATQPLCCARLRLSLIARVLELISK
jgi:hypothetical protein